MSETIKNLTEEEYFQLGELYWTFPMNMRKLTETFARQDRQIQEMSKYITECYNDWNSAGCISLFDKWNK